MFLSPYQEYCVCFPHCRFVHTKLEFISDGRSLKEYDSLVVVGEKLIADPRLLPRFQAANVAIKAQLEVCA